MQSSERGSPLPCRDLIPSKTSWFSVKLSGSVPAHSAHFNLHRPNHFSAAPPKRELRSVVLCFPPSRPANFNDQIRVRERRLHLLPPPFPLIAPHCFFVSHVSIFVFLLSKGGRERERDGDVTPHENKTTQPDTIGKCLLFALSKMPPE